MRNNLPLIRVLGALALAACGLTASAATKNSPASVSVVSPNGKNQIDLKVNQDAQQLLYSVARNGRIVVETSPIEIRLSETGLLTTGVSIQHAEERVIDETSTLPWGKTREFRNHCRETSVRLKSGNGKEWVLEVRVYDDGVAFRYGVRSENESRELLIEDESTQFRLAGDSTVIYMTVDNFHNSHEAPYEKKPLSDVPIGKLIDKPLLAVWQDGTAAAITEARLRNFAGMYLERPKGAAINVLRCRLSPLLNKPQAVVATKAPFWSPWRVILLSDHAGKLIESNLLLSLNEPAEGDFSWIKPGKTTWPWWNGTIEHGPVLSPKENFAIHKKYIDFCARNNIAYHSVICVGESRPWYVQSGPPGFDPRGDTDVLTPRPDLGLPAILAYAKEKGVGIRLWVWWQPISKKMEEAFATYERWGVKGLMVDFLDRDDQEMVEWQEKCLRVAARHKLEIQFHGSYKPTGEQRTFPNLFNREGVLNLEYSKWSDLCSPPHDVSVAYTRLLAGPVDYHLGGFRAAARDKFKPRDELPTVLGTRCHQLAMYVVFENPMPMVCDVPTTWDETRFVAGEAGEYIIVARRSKDTWYLGGMTNWTSRKLSVPLNFLGDGRYEAKLYLDRSLDGENPNDLRIDTRGVSADKKLDLSFASGGGMAAVIRPK